MHLSILLFLIRPWRAVNTSHTSDVMLVEVRRNLLSVEKRNVLDSSLLQSIL
jgi:hypothetical protein